MASQLTKALLGVLALSCAFTANVGAEGRPRYGQTLAASLLEEPLNLDPVKVRTHADMVLVSMIFDTLYRLKGGAIVPHLASALPDRSDPLHVRVRLRPGVAFSNGRILSAEDVVLSLERLRKSQMYHYMGSVASIERVVPTDAAEPSEGKLVSEEIVFNLRIPDPQLAKRLTNVHTSISEKGLPPTFKRAIGTGAFHLKERSSARKEVRLQASEKHFAGRSYVDEVKLHWYDDKSSEARQYETGRTHLSSRGSIAFAGHKPKFRTRKLESGAWILSYIGFGRSQSIDSEADFHGIVSAAIARSGMMQIGSGEDVVPTLSPVPAKLRRGSSKQGLTPDRGQIGKLMTKLIPRYPALNLGSLSLELIVNSSRPDDAAIGAKVAAALFAFGIRTRIVSLSATAYARRVRTGKYDVRVGQLALSSPFAADALRASFSLAGRKVESSSRAALERRFDTELPIVPLFHKGLRIHHRSDLYGVSFAAISSAHGGSRPMFENIYLVGEPEKN